MDKGQLNDRVSQADRASAGSRDAGNRAAQANTQLVLDQLTDRTDAPVREVVLIVDSVARFHIGNGARLERIDWLGDLSPKGLRESAGIMVNYLESYQRLR